MLIQKIKALSHALKQLWVREDGQDLVEYILLFMFIVVAAIVGIVAFGTRILALYNSVIGTF